ncbi:MAG: amidophosphoribosyltransferase [Cyanobacteria bacterium P01_F01_bin.150]
MTNVDKQLASPSCQPLHEAPLLALEAPPFASADPDKPKEYCGVFGIYAPQEEVAKLTYFGLYALQHRGQEAAGIATYDGEELHLHKDAGLVSQVFNESILETLPGYMAIGHTRYSTTGGNRADNAHPMVTDTRLGTVAVAHNGNLINAFELREELIANHYFPKTSSDTEMLTLAIAEAIDSGKDWLEGCIQAFRRCRGAFSLTIITPDGLIGTRDHQGIRPLVIGVMPNPDGDPTAPKRYVLASETCGLDIVGAEYLREVEPGELVWITEDGLASYHWAKPDRKLCVFEMIYFSRPDSLVHEESLYAYRQRLGKQLAIEAPADADLVMGVPDSGIPAAIGFSEESGVRYAEGLIKNRYVGRTFIQPTQSMREIGIRMKLNPLKGVLEGKRVVVIDDSIVRGTTSRKIVKALRDAGAIEVHMRISSPPVTHPCFFGIDTDTQDQLIAAKLSVEEIAKRIGVDSLAYLTWEGMLDNAGDERNHFCSGCFTGKYPLEIPPEVQRSKLMLEMQTMASVSS